MATKGGSLLGRADSMLVQGAFRSEMANVGRDMGDVYKLQAENVGNLQTAIQDIFYATNKSNNDLYNDVKEKSSLILADIESGTFSDDDSIGLYTNAINDLRNKMKSIPRGKEGEAERAKVRAQLAKMKADTALGEGVITEIATLLKNDQVNMPASADAMVVFQSILDGKAKREIINGELVYSTKNAQENIIKLNHNELNKKFIKKDYDAESGALKVSSIFSKTGLQGGKYDFVGAANLYESIMTTENGVLHLINKPFGSMKISFVEALKGGDPKLVGEMIGALNSIGGFDVDDDSKPDKITQANVSKLVSTLTNQNDENFNLATTKRVAAAFYADNDGRAQHKKGLDIFNAKQNKLNPPAGDIPEFKYYVKYSGGSFSPPDAKTFYLDLTNGVVDDPRDNTEYRFLNGKNGEGWYEGDKLVYEDTKILLRDFGIKDFAFQNITPNVVEQDMRSEGSFDSKYKTGADYNFLEGGDDKVSSNFNDIIYKTNDERNAEGYRFKPTETTGFFKGVDEPFLQSITLYDRFDNIAFRPNTGSTETISYKVPKGATEGEMQEMMADILDDLNDLKLLKNIKY